MIIAVQYNLCRHSSHCHLYRHLSSIFTSQMRCLLLAVVVGAAGVLGASMPPIATHVHASTHSHDLPTVPEVNWGLSGVVAEELWEE